MKAIALVVSAREHGNCYDFARFTLDVLHNNDVETELINFYDHQTCYRKSRETDESI
jgi:multimeric flavodoxin WrbA